MTFNKTCCFACVFSVFCASAYCQDKSVTEGQQQIEDFSISGFGEKGKKDWDLQGKSADISSEVIKLNEIVSNLYNEKDNVKLTAEKGDFDKAKSKVHLEDNVVITTSSGAKMTTDSLDWDRGTQIVSTSDKVNIEKETMVATAIGATGYPNLNKVSLEKNVQVNINTPEAKAQDAALNRIIITCDGPMEVDYQKNKAVFQNNVKVETKDAVICSDVMDVFFRQSQGAEGSKDKKRDMFGGSGTHMDKIVAKGNVKIIRGENVSYSEEAIYNAQDAKITLVGQPKLVIYSKEDLSASFGNKRAQ